MAVMLKEGLDLDVDPAERDKPCGKEEPLWLSSSGWQQKYRTTWSFRGFHPLSLLQTKTKANIAQLEIAFDLFSGHHSLFMLASARAHFPYINSSSRTDRFCREKQNSWASCSLYHLLPRLYILFGFDEIRGIRHTFPTQFKPCQDGLLEYLIVSSVQRTQEGDAWMVDLRIWGQERANDKLARTKKGPNINVTDVAGWHVLQLEYVISSFYISTVNIFATQLWKTKESFCLTPLTALRFRTGLPHNNNIWCPDSWDIVASISQQMVWKLPQVSTLWKLPSRNL